ncbi:PQQ-binding-like beta-propeller repeat protein [Tundrisphaera sp. TA3]|uniref:outer membrane protein assembly factor BamB family protein n=1 Tax=Tundrisphaera sp. TA3 TaxID=3435775 RepID=UPI003EB8BDC1
MAQGERGIRRARRRFGWLAALAIAALAGTPVQAQFGPIEGGDRAETPVYFETSFTADALLRSAANHARGGHHAEAVEIYQRIIQQFGDFVVETTDEPADPALAGLSRLAIGVRRECQNRIAALPPEARALYRARVDGQAERWFQQGRSDRDRAPLRRIVDQAFCSSWGDDALELLGDLAFQDGRFGEALTEYVALMPDAPDGGPGAAMTHPDPSVDPARLAAKKLLARAAIGERPPTEGELKAFAAAYPGAAGPFAGRRGPLAEALAQAIRNDHLATPAQPDGRWPTFAGAQARTKVAPSPIDVGSLQWRVDLEPIPSSTARMSLYPSRMRTFSQPMALPIPPERLLAYFPIVVGDQVIVDDERQVLAYDLNSRPGEGIAPSGPIEPAWRSEKSPPGSGPMANRGFQGIPRYTLTAFGDRIYARMGSPPSTLFLAGRGNINFQASSAPSFVVALDRGADGKRLWKKDASEINLTPRKLENEPGSNVVFEGTPVADARNVYVALTERSVNTNAHVACLDADTGNVRWIRWICRSSAGTDPNGRPEVGLRLLTHDGSTLYFQTNLGAVAALDPETGAIRWLATYPTRPGAGADRDLNPAIVHDGLVIVAPNDAPAIYAFDAATGRLAWKTGDIPEEVHLAHLLGVAKGHLVATGDRVLLFDAKTGKMARSWPDSNQATQGFGRGLLAGDRIYWPTRSEIHVLDPETGLRPEPSIKLRESFQCEGGGNLAVGDGYLVVAQANALIVFCQTSRLIERFKVEIARSPEKASNYYLLARAAEATGRDEEALASLEMVPSRARPSEIIDGLLLADVARDQQRRILMKLGGKARAARAWDEAARRYRQAAEVARTDRDRLEARLDLAGVQVDAGRAPEAIDTLQGVLADAQLRTVATEAPDGHRSIRADLLIADRLAALLRDRGRDLYAAYDREAESLLDRGRRERDPRLLEDIGRAYPAARVVPDAWLALAELSDELGHPADAARAYKKLLAAAPDDALRARALWGLARSYEAQKLWVSARDAYLQASARFAEQPLGAGDRVGPAVAARLARAPFDRMRGDRAGPGVPVPLRRRWDLHPAGDIRPIGAAGVPPSAEAGRVFLAQGPTIRPVDPATGASGWIRDLGGEPIWVGYLADRIIAATPRSLVALALDDGQIQWRQDLGGPAPATDAAPFGPAPPGTPRDDSETSGPLADFRIVGNRVFCLEGDRRLLAVDGDSGLVDWSYTPANGGRINPRLHVGPGRIVLQARKPNANATLVLDTATGRRRAEFAAGDEDAWPIDPLPIDEDHVALVVDRMSVALFDTNRGVRVWSLREPVDLPKNGPTRLIGDADRLLVLLDGRELVRVDPATGARLWSRFLGGEDLSEHPDSLAMSGDRVFVASGRGGIPNDPSLFALSMAEGAVLWRRPLTGPDSGWSIAPIDRDVAAYPDPARLTDKALGSLPLAFHRREDGGLIQRFVFQAPAADLTFLPSPLGAVVATRGGLWALGDRRVMDGGRMPE